MNRLIQSQEVCSVRWARGRRAGWRNEASNWPARGPADSCGLSQQMPTPSNMPTMSYLVDRDIKPRSTLHPCRHPTHMPTGVRHNTMLGIRNPSVRMNDRDKFYGEFLREQVETYNKLENWGASLFLGGIALAGKQLVEWDQAGEEAERIALHPSACIFPAVVGLVAFVFLRIVNYRGFKEAESLRRLLSITDGKPSWGALGLLLAAMPLTLGFALSCYLVTGKPERQAALLPVWWLGGIAIVAGLAFHIWHRCCRNVGATSSTQENKDA